MWSSCCLGDTRSLTHCAGWGIESVSQCCRDAADAIEPHQELLYLYLFTHIILTTILWVLLGPFCLWGNRVTGKRDRFFRVSKSVAGFVPMPSVSRAGDLNHWLLGFHTWGGVELLQLCHPHASPPHPTPDPGCPSVWLLRCDGLRTIPLRVILASWGLNPGLAGPLRGDLGQEGRV